MHHIHENTSHNAYIGLGSNIGNSLLVLQKAINCIENINGVVNIKKSNFYQTSPVDSYGNDYINSVICIEFNNINGEHSIFTPIDLLNTLQSIELDFGRERPYRYAPRTLDLDILLYDKLVYKDERLIIPHPHMLKRAFVLVPLLELNPNICIPLAGYGRDYLQNTTHQSINRICV